MKGKIQKRKMAFFGQVGVAHLKYQHNVSTIFWRSQGLEHQVASKT
jgi:hypothetical protein